MSRMARYLVVFWIAIPAQLLAGTTYYVATNGSDSYNGLSPSYQGGASGPFRTLGKAARMVMAGDTVQIRGGTYQEESAWYTHGTEANPITITNYNGEIVIIDGNNCTIPADEYGILLKISGDWYTISNLEISYSGYYGLIVSGEHCTIDNIFCHHSWAAGITCRGSYGLVKNCRAWYNSARYEWGEGGRWSTGISVMGPGIYYSTIRNCTAWENWGQGIKAALGYHLTIEDCVAYDNMYNFYIRNAQHVLFQRNLSYNMPGNLLQPYIPSQVAILIGDETPDIPSSDNTFINNLAMGGRYVISIGSHTFENGLCAHNTLVNGFDYYESERYNVRIGRGTYTNARFENNIVLQENSIPIAINGSSGILFGHNNWSSLPPGDCQGTGDIIADPSLAKTGPMGAGLLTPAWFKILSNSPAKDRAAILSRVSEDFFKTPRGNAPDIGAYEIPN